MHMTSICRANGSIFCQCLHKGMVLLREHKKVSRIEFVKNQNQGYTQATKFIMLIYNYGSIFYQGYWEEIMMAQLNTQSWPKKSFMQILYQTLSKTFKVNWQLARTLKDHKNKVLTRVLNQIVSRTSWWKSCCFEDQKDTRTKFYKIYKASND